MGRRVILPHKLWMLSGWVQVKCHGVAIWYRDECFCRKCIALNTDLNLISDSKMFYVGCIVKPKVISDIICEIIFSGFHTSLTTQNMIDEALGLSSVPWYTHLGVITIYFQHYLVVRSTTNSREIVSRLAWNLFVPANNTVYFIGQEWLARLLLGVYLLPPNYTSHLGCNKGWQ